MPAEVTAVDHMFAERAMEAGNNMASQVSLLNIANITQHSHQLEIISAGSTNTSTAKLNIQFNFSHKGWTLKF